MDFPQLVLYFLGIHVPVLQHAKYLNPQLNPGFFGNVNLFRGLENAVLVNGLPPFSLKISNGSSSHQR